MGNHGHNAGGYAWMEWRTCRCGRRFVIGKQNPERWCYICRRGGDGTPKRCKAKPDKEGVATMKVRLTQNLPLEDKHGAFAGKVFDCLRYDDDGGRGRMAWFMGDAGEECAAYLNRECVLLEPRHE